MGNEIYYRGYYIEYNPPPIPTYNMDFAYYSEDYDGPQDYRYGYGKSVEDCKHQIDLILEEHENEVL